MDVPTPPGTGPGEQPAPDHHFSPAGRLSEIGIGLLLAPFALATAALGILALSHVASHPDTAGHLLLFGVLTLMFGGWLCLISYRMIAHRPRRDGGLFSPIELRIAGLTMALAIILLVWLTIFHGTLWSWLALLKLLTMVSFVFGCFHLARRREEAERTPEGPIG